MRTNFSMFNYKNTAIIFFIIFLSFQKNIQAQDPRIPQISDLSMIMNPANTGNFTGATRLHLLYNYSNNGAFENAFFRGLVNNIYNFSVDHKFGKQNDWGFGLNIMNTNGHNYIISGNFYSLSLSKQFILDKLKQHRLFFGTQFSYNYGSFNEAKGEYSILLDVGGFKYNPPKNTPYLIKNTADYFNLAFGGLYKFKTDNFTFEAGLGFNNLLQPDYSIVSDNVVRKRIRISGNTNFAYKINTKNSIKAEHISWKEGMYMNNIKPATDSSDITDAIYGLSWYNFNNKGIMGGLMFRSSKSFILSAGLKYNQSFITKLCVEFPFNYAYYPVTQIGISFNYILYNKKNNTPLSNEVF